GAASVAPVMGVRSTVVVWCRKIPLRRRSRTAVRRIAARRFEQWNMSLLVIRRRDLPNRVGGYSAAAKLTVSQGLRNTHASHMTDALRAKILAGIAASLGAGLVLELAEVGMQIRRGVENLAPIIQ